MALTLHGTVSDNTVALDRKTATPLIINGDMQIAQRGTSQASVGGGTTGNYYTIDRMQTGAGASPSARFTQSQSTDVPTGQGFSSSLKMDCTTAQTGLSGSSANIRIVQPIEGQNLQMIKKGTSSAETITLSFWVKSNKTGTYICELRDYDNTRTCSISYTISSSSTWEKKVINFPADTTGAFDNDNAQSLDVAFFLVAGDNLTSGTLQTTWDTFTTADRAVGQVNLADSTSNEWYLTGLQMEVGTFDSNSIPDFQFEDRATSLARCQRYYQIHNEDAEAIFVYAASYTSHQATFSYNIPFHCRMRTQPTVSTPSTSHINTGTITMQISDDIANMRGNSNNSGSGARITSSITIDAEL